MGLQYWQEEAKPGTGHLTGNLLLLLKVSHSLLCIHTASESASTSDSPALELCGNQTKEKSTSEKSQKNPLWLTSL